MVYYTIYILCIDPVVGGVAVMLRLEMCEFRRAKIDHNIRTVHQIRNGQERLIWTLKESIVHASLTHSR